MAEVTPMMRQYLDIKQQYKDTILFFRLGDFYEMFFDDAILASRELEIVLTGKDCGMSERAPMCGIPYHAVDGYVEKLISKGYKVAICEQLIDPAEAKGLVDRDVIRIITPGTVIEPSILNERENNFIASAVYQGEAAGFAYCDVSTGAFFAGEVSGFNSLLNELIRISPKEIIVSETLKDRESEMKDALKSNVMVECFGNDDFDLSAAKDTLKAHFGDLTKNEAFQYELALKAAGALMAYLTLTQKNALNHITELTYCRQAKYMTLDSTTRRNLELTATIMDGGKRGSLLWILDNTKTSMGARKLRGWLTAPLKDEDDINARLDAVGELMASSAIREELLLALGGIRDIERIVSRISYGNLDARDCLALKQSCARLPRLKQLGAFFKCAPLQAVERDIDPLNDITALLERAIKEDAPVGIKDGGIIKEGYHEEIDRLKTLSGKSRELIAALEAKEREETGIKNLKINYNRVFGYYIEVTKSYLESVPYRYTRRQTLANAERFITAELKTLEDEILSADEKCKKLEYLEFIKIRDILCENISRLKRTADAVATLDALLSHSVCAIKYGYSRPKMGGDILEIKDGRHPVVERLCDGFVPNDTFLNGGSDRMLIITGPNMAGKSTYMRQVGLITLMAHIGSFVPAKEARVPIVDRIFTRVGASDDLASGRSTFMVEMSEVANILTNATNKSLIILDEIGRGTSTVDGLSIARAVVEYIIETFKAKTLFATHFHELTELEQQLKGVKNYSITVKEYGNEVIFLRKIVRGGTNRSFGIEVAKLAGLPERVTERAKQIMNEHYTEEVIPLKREIPSDDELRSLINSVKVENLTPLEALNVLNNLVERAK